MKRAFTYLRYVARHKWWVFVACRAAGVGFWQAVAHDWHKLLPDEFGPYMRTFYAADGSGQYAPSNEFARAWHLHQKRGRHHWQHWLLTWDRGDTEPLPMPDKFVREMVADWYGAGRAITGKWEAREWYEKNRDKIRLEDRTRVRVEGLLALADLKLNGGAS